MGRRTSKKLVFHLVEDGDVINTYVPSKDSSYLMLLYEMELGGVNNWLRGNQVFVERSEKAEMLLAKYGYIAKYKSSPGWRRKLTKGECDGRVHRQDSLFAHGT